MTKSIASSTGHDAGGNFVEWCRDDDGGSGYGEGAEVCRWYGTRQECNDMLMRLPPKGCKWHRVGTSPL